MTEPYRIPVLEDERVVHGFGSLFANPDVSAIFLLSSDRLHVIEHGELSRRLTPFGDALALREFRAALLALTRASDGTFAWRAEGAERFWRMSWSEEEGAALLFLPVEFDEAA